MCRIKFDVPPRRNYIIEEMLAKLPAICNYAVYGCNTKIDQAMKDKHEFVCEYNRTVKCPRMVFGADFMFIRASELIISCPWSDNVDILAEHLINYHKIKVIEKSQDSVCLTYQRAFRVVDSGYAYRREVLIKILLGM